VTGGRVSPFLATLEAAGGITGDYHGLKLVRHFGDPAAEYAAATQGAAVFDRSHRCRLTVSGRSPRQMLNGVLTGALPDEPSDLGGDVSGGVASYHTVLTPKGRMVSDLIAVLPGDEEAPGFLLDVPVAGRIALLESFGKFLPPRFAAVTDVSEELASISVVGPEAPAVLSRLALGLRVDDDWFGGAAEGEWRRVGTEPGGTMVSRTLEVGAAAWTVYGSTDAVGALLRSLIDADVQPAGLGVWSTLRVEAGRPVFGTDMDDRTIPPEAGIVDRAIDQNKGCYTGQEVIVRIRDRGHVNRHLRRFELGDVPAPPKGAELLATDGTEKVVGHLTSVVQSPRQGGVLALGYVRRGVDRVLLNGREISVPDDFPEPLES
jgi:folate-binding protein YgfZ